MKDKALEYCSTNWKEDEDEFAACHAAVKECGHMKGKLFFITEISFSV